MSLLLKASSAKDLCCEARDKANSEAILASLEATRSKAKLASKGKIVASPCEATLSGKVILASPITKKKAFKAKCLPLILQRGKLTKKGSRS